MKLANCMVWMIIPLLFSCNPTERRTEIPEEEMFPVKFSLHLEEEVLPFSPTRGIPPLNISEPSSAGGEENDGSPEALCSAIEYIVYKDGESVPCRNTTFTREDVDFGQISDQLPRGGYTFIVVAHNASSTELAGNRMVFDRVTDTFHYTFPLEIEAGDRIEETVTLYRVVNKTEFVSTDIVPKGAKDFTIQLDKYPCILDLSTGHGVVAEGNVPLFTYPLTEHAGERGIPHAFYTFVPEGGISLSAKLQTTDTEGNTLRERTVENIQPIVNKIIRYKTMLYNPSQSDNDFTIVIDEGGEWDETIENELPD
ncbi:MAG: hypothetical protein LBV32_02795 [Tannerellaceae bacterium]|nr:hypothetical protein [Tannerellaceae bacterium]